MNLKNWLHSNILKKNGTVFCGAGISRNSGLPIVNDLVTELLSYLGATIEDIQIFQKSRIPFELFIEEVYKTSNSKFTKFNEIFTLGIPNNNHEIFVHLLNEGIFENIITTNFDLLFEKSHLDSKFDILIEENEFNDFTLGKTLIKIHGCASNSQSIRSTMNKIYKSELKQSRDGIIRKIISNCSFDKPLIFVGYSFSDHFDLNPSLIQYLNSESYIIIIEYISGSSNHYIEDLSKTPFSNSKGMVLKINIDYLIKALYEVLNLKYTFKTSATKWKKNLYKSVSKLSKLQKNNCLFRIYSSLVEKPQIALKYLEKEISESQKVTDYSQQFNSLYNLCCIELNDPLHLDALIKLKVSKKLDKPIYGLRVRYLQDNLLFNNGDFKLILMRNKLDYYSDLKVNSSELYCSARSLLLYSLIILREYEKAKILENELIEFSNESGLLLTSFKLQFSKAVRYKNIYSKNKLSASTKSLEMSQNIGRFSLIENSIFLHVQNLLTLNMETESEKYFNLWEKINLITGNKALYIQYLNNLNLYFYQLKKYKTLENSVRKTITESKKQEKYEVTLTCYNYILVLIIDHKFVFKITYIDEIFISTKNISTKTFLINTQETIRNLFYNLGLIYYKESNYNKALNSFNMSLEIDQKFIRMENQNYSTSKELKSNISSNLLMIEKIKETMANN